MIPLWGACFEQLIPIVHAYLAAHGILRPLPSREDVRTTARLYWRFTNVQPGPELEEFARGLSFLDYARLCEACKQALWVASPAEASGIRQRLAQVQTFRAARTEERPDPANGLYLGDGTRIVVRRGAHGSEGSKHTWSRRRK